MAAMTDTIWLMLAFLIGMINGAFVLAMVIHLRNVKAVRRNKMRGTA